MNRADDARSPLAGEADVSVGAVSLDTADDTRPMLRALALAERGRGRVEPNPVVGCVIVRDGAVVGEGWHQRFGGPHAEVEALAVAGPRAAGATVYVTLEPCNHHGKTPPCVDALVAAGVSRVVYAVADPHPEAGGGAERLRAAGIACEPLPRGDLAADEAARANAPFFKRVRRGLPFVTLKWAMTLDGKIATATGDSRWVSGEESRRLVHRLRDRADAVLVGIGTALADDPELTSRLENGAGRTPVRVVVDAHARLPLESRLVRTAGLGPVVVAATEAAPPERIEALRVRGVEVLLAGDGSRGVDLVALARALAFPAHPAGGEVSSAPAASRFPAARRPVTNLMVEGGGRVNAAFLEAGLVDRIMVFVAPKVAGGSNAPTPVEGVGAERMADALRIARLRAVPLGEDILLEADLPPGEWSSSS